MRLLCAGIDTLHLSAINRCDVPEVVLDAGDKATATHLDTPFEWADERGVLWTLLAQPGGGRHAEYTVCKGRDFDLRLYRRSSKKCSAVEIRAEALWAQGAHSIAAEIAAAASALMGRPGGSNFWRVSRADLCADVHCNFVESDTARWRQLATFDASHVGLGVEGQELLVGADETHHEHRVFTGWDFGRGDPLLARIYNKTVQAKTKAPWIFDLWARCPNYNPDRTVWRVEFECKRGALKAFGVNHLEHLQAAQTGIWRYLTWVWLTLRATTKHDKEKAIAASWRWISEGAFDPLFLGSTPMARREPKDRLDMRQTMAQSVGLLTNLGAAFVRAGLMHPDELDGMTDVDLFPEWMRPAAREAIKAGMLKSRDTRAAFDRALKKRVSVSDKNRLNRARS